MSATLAEGELASWRAAHVARLHVFADAAVSASAVGSLPQTHYPSEIGAKPLQSSGVTGTGVTVAVVDSGIWSQLGPDKSAPEQTSNRVLTQYDVIAANQGGSVSAVLKGLTSVVASNTSNINVS